MDDLLGEALEALSTDVRALLPSPASPSLAPTLLIAPQAVVPTGLGGYVGPSVDPAGDLRGRRIRANVELGVQSQTPDDLEGALSRVSLAMLTATRGDTANGDLLRVAHDDSPPPAGTPTARTLRFDVLYEFLRHPAEAGGVISEVLVDLDAGTMALGQAVRVGAAAGMLSRFDVVDDPAAIHHLPSEWDVDPTEPAIVQRAETWGGATGTGPVTPGTMLVLRPTPSTMPARDLILRTAFTSDAGGVGAVWRWQGPDDFYFVLFDVDRGVRRIGRKVGGVFDDLDEPAADTTVGYAPGPHHLKVRAVGQEVAAWLDGDQVLDGSDASITGSGRVGLLTRRNTTARFTGLAYVPLEGGTPDG